jgi:2-octaprenyl-6-methoxyphenol hydroxylase
MARKMHSDVIILGGGLVGLTLAVALDAHGLTSVVVDPADPAALLAPGHDARASAVASASWAMLEAIGVTPALADEGCAIHAIRVAEGLSPGGLTFAPRDERPLGTMVPNRVLRRALYAAAAAAPGVTLAMPAQPLASERDAAGVRVTLADGRILSSPLLIAAEGRNSPTREAAGIRVTRWRYDHAGIIATIGHERPHQATAYEIFYPSGPFAILPLRDGDDGGHRSAIVWTVAAADGPATAALPDRAFAAELVKRMGGLLGAVRLEGPRATYPLGFHHAARITADRLALVGDAAHGIHPIAGQGLNLGFRDVAALVEVLVEGGRLGMDLGDAQLLARYQRWRSLDTLMVAAATDSLTRLFGLPGKAASGLRRAGLTLVSRAAPLRDMFMAEARGESGTLPMLLRGTRV